MESGEVKYEKVYVSTRPPPTISFTDNWMKELDSEVAGSSKDTNESNQNQKNNYQGRGDPWVDQNPSRVACQCRVKISHGLNKLVTDLNKEDDDNEQETSEVQFEEFALKTNVLAFASRSKAKAKPRRRTSACSSTRTVPICERSWTDVEPGTYSHNAYPVSKRLSTLLRYGQLPREEDGAIEFWKLTDYLRNDFEYSQH